MDNSLINLIIEQRRDIKNILPKRKAEDFIDSLYRLLFNLDIVPCECHYEIEQQLKMKQLEFSQIIYDYCKSDQTAQRETLSFFNNV